MDFETVFFRDTERSRDTAPLCLRVAVPRPRVVRAFQQALQPGHQRLPRGARSVVAVGRDVVAADDRLLARIRKGDQRLFLRRSARPAAPADDAEDATTAISSASRSRSSASARAARSASAERDRATGSVAFAFRRRRFRLRLARMLVSSPRLEENSAALARRISSICASCCCRARARFDASVSRSMSFAVGFTPGPPTVSSGAGSRPLKSRRCVVASRSPAATHASSFALSHVVSG